MSYCMHKCREMALHLLALVISMQSEGTDDVSINRPLRLRGMKSLPRKSRRALPGEEAGAGREMERRQTFQT